MDGEFSQVIAGAVSAGAGAAAAIGGGDGRRSSRALDADELSREAIQQRDQHLWFHSEPDGSMVIRGQVPAEVGTWFKRVLEAALDSLPIPENVPAGTS
jgi:hypothetical protein